MSLGVFQLMSTGALVYRDAAGNPTSPPGVQNAYSPPASFTSSCELTGVPSDCTARFDPGQLNAIVSEMLCFASTMTPGGNWDCSSTCNLGNNFTAFATGFGPGTLRNYVDLYETPTTLMYTPVSRMLTYAGEDVVNNIDLSSLLGASTDPLNILSNGSDLKPHLSAQDVSGAICGDTIARLILVNCVLSGDAGNIVTIGTDGGLFVSTEGASSDPCADPAALANCVRSADVPNLIVFGSDGRLLVKPADIVSAICADPVIKDALADCLVSPAAGNTLTSDGTGLYVPPSADGGGGGGGTTTGSASGSFVSVMPVAGNGYVNTDTAYPGPTVGQTYTVVNSAGMIVLQGGGMFWKPQQGMPPLVVGDKYVFNGVTGSIPNDGTADYYYVGGFTKI